MTLTLTTDERIAALERRIADAEFAFDVEQNRRARLERELAALQGRKITVGDLPIAALRRKLEMLGGLDAAMLLEAGSITPDLLSVELRELKVA